MAISEAEYEMLLARMRQKLEDSRSEAPRNDRPAKTRRLPSKLEEAVLGQIRAFGLPEPEREYRFHPTRRWRLDFAWPDRAIAIEVQGGIYGRVRSGHSTGKGIERDAEKACYAALAGFRVFYLTEHSIKDGSGVALVAKALQKPS